jgi:SAM-dependent methyltransferase
VAEQKAETRADFDPERYWTTRLGERYSLAGVGWFGLSEAFNRWMYAVRRRAFRRALSGRLDPGGARVLDVGSGTGFYVALWRELGSRHVTGSDLTAVAVEGLRTSFPGLRFEQCDISETSLELGGPYDSVSAMDMLFHIVDDERYDRALRNLAELLVPGGFLLLTENLPHGETLRVPHQVSRSFEDVVALLADAGLEIVSRRPLFVLMNTPVDSDSALLRRLFAGVHFLARRNVTGWLVGAVLYPIELVLTRFLREGPTTEIVLCRKRRI